MCAISQTHHQTKHLSFLSPIVTEFIHLLIYKSVRVEGFNVMTYFPQREEGLKELVGWFKEVCFLLY